MWRWCSPRRSWTGAASRAATTENADRPAADYGALVLHNATRRTWHAALLRGASVPSDYLAHARTLGLSDAEHRCGNVTVGRVMAAHVPGLKDDDWHQSVVVGASRYALLTEAVDKLSLAA